MSLWAICCTVDIPAEFISRFLEATYEEHEALLNQGDHFQQLVVVDRLGGDPYTEPTIPPLSTTGPDVSSPFKGKTAVECARLLREEAQRPDSAINVDFFIILDERTLRDSSILVCEANDEEPEIVSYRSIYKTAQSSLFVLEIAKPDISEFVWHAELEEDGVLK